MKKTLFLLILLISCRSKLEYAGDVEIYCPRFSKSFIIEGVGADDVYEALEKYIEQEIREHNDHGFTVLRFRDGSTMRIRGIGARDLSHCEVHNVNHSYERKYFVF